MWLKSGHLIGWLGYRQDFAQQERDHATIITQVSATIGAIRHQIQSGIKK
jgi:hypothetical protein